MKKVTTNIFIGIFILIEALFAPSTLALSYFGIESLLPLKAEAAFNQQINYQGKLMTTGGSVVADGTYHMRFKLYTVLSGGVAIWSEDRSTAAGDRIVVDNGLFSAMLGSSTPFTGIDFNQTLYLGVEIGGSGGSPSWDGEMAPRKILGAVPAAFVSDTLDGLDSTEFVRSNSTSTIATSSAQTVLTINQTGAGNLLDVRASGVSQLLVGPTGLTITNSTSTNTFATTASSTNLFSTNLRTGNLTISGQTFTTLLGSGLLNTGGALTLDNTGAWTGTFDGQEGVYYLDRTNHSGTQLASTISDFNDTVNSYIHSSTTIPKTYTSNLFTGANIFDLITRSTTTNATTTTLFSSIASSTNLFSTNFNLGIGVFGNATGTNIFTTTASSTNLFATNFNFGSGVLGRATTTNIFSTTASSTNLFSTNANIANLIVGSCTGCSSGTAASSTLLSDNNNFTGTNTFGNLTYGNATGTTIFNTTASSTNLFSTNFNLGLGSFGQATGTNIFTTTASSTNLFATNANFGNLTLGSTTVTNLLVTGSSTLQNFTFVNATGTRATTTNLFSTTASSTNLFSTNANFGLSLLGNATSSNIFSGTASSTNLFATNANLANLTVGSSTHTNLLVMGSSTIQNFTFVNATGTRATTTNIFSTTASSTNLFSTNANFGLSLLGNATSSNIFSGTASSTNLFATNANFGNLTLGSTTVTNLLVTGSTTLQNFTALNSTSTNATTTTSFAGTASSTNLFATNFNFGTGVLGRATTTNIFSTTASSTNLFSTNANFGLSILGNATSSNIFSTTASSTNLFSSNLNTGAITASGAINGQTISSAANFTGTLTATGGLTTLSNLLVTGSSTLQNFTALNSTSTNATTTTSFAGTASSTKLFATTYNFGSGFLGNATATNFNIGGKITGAGLTTCSGSGDKLIWNATTQQFACGADAGAGGGITAIGAQYSSFQTGSSQTFATSSDTNIGLTITSTGDIHTFTPTWTGTLTGTRGGTGLSSVTQNSLLIGGAGNTWTQVATSSLGISTTDIIEGTKLFYTDDRVNSYIHSSTTIPKTYTSNLFTGANIFDLITRSTTTNATTTTLFSSIASSTNLFSTNFNLGIGVFGNATGTNIFTTTASSTNLFATNFNFGSGSIGSLNLGTLNLSSALTVANGGTGASTFGQGWIYSDGGTGALAASTSPTVRYITATSTTATSTLPILSINGAGSLKLIVASNPSPTTIVNSVWAGLGNVISSCESCGTTGGNLLGIANYGNGVVGINTWNARGTTNNPTATQSGDSLYFMGGRGFGSTVWNTGSKAVINFVANQIFTDSANGTYITLETTPNDSTTRLERMRIDSTGNVGIGTTSPYAKLSVVGEVVAPYYTATSTTGTSTFPNIYSSGRIGIATVNPRAPIEVFGNSNIYTQIGNGTIGVISNANSGNLLTLEAGGLPDYIMDVRTTSGNSGNIFNIGAIGRGGFVGIGTSTPYAKLSVVGEVVGANFTATTTGTNTFPRLIFTLATGTSATTTNIFSTTASSTNLFSTNANIGNLIVGSCTGCSSGSAASSTLLSDNNNFSGTNTFANLTYGNATGTTIFNTTASSTNLFATNATTTSLYSSVLSVANGGTQSPSILFGQGSGEISGISYAGSPTRRIDFTINGTQAFSVGRYDSGVSLGSLASYGFTADYSTGTVDSALARNSAGVLEVNSGTLGQYRDLIYRNSTATSATTTTLFSSTASSTNLFSTNFNLGSGSIGSLNLGTLNLSSALTVANGGTGASSFGQGWIYSDGGTGALAASTSPTVRYITATSTTATSTFAGGISGTNNFTVQSSSGRVGIGTNAPFATLDARSSTGEFVFANTNATAQGQTSKIIFATASNFLNDDYWNKGPAIGGVIDDSVIVGSGLAFYTYPVSGIQTERMRISNTGNVGIGTTSPYSKLGIWGGSTGNILEGVTSASTTVFSVSATGFGTTTLAGLSIVGQATSTSNVGINLSGGCYAISGTCLTSGGSSASSTLLADNNNFTGTNTFSSGLTTIANLLATGSSTLQNFTFVNATGTSATTTNLFSNNISSLVLLASSAGFTNLLTTSSTTLQNFTFVNATGTRATTTNIFSTTASSTNLFSTNANFGLSLLGNATSSNIFSGTASSTNLFTTNFNFGAGVFGRATTTNLFSTTASSTNLFSSLLNVGSNALVVNSSNKVGIGSSSPWGRLSVEMDTSSPSFVVSNNGSTSPLFYIGGVNDAGYVGIGTNAPTHKLTILNHSGSVTSSDGLVIDTLDNVNPIIGYSVAGTRQFTFGVDIADSNKFKFKTGLFSVGGGVTRLSIDSGGNVGIGTSTSYSKLSIWGGSTGNILEGVTSASTTVFSVSATGFGTTTLAGLSIVGQATSTSNVGINLSGGCFAISGTCLTSGGSSASSTLLSDNNNFTGTNTFGNLTFGNATGTTIFNTTASSTNLFATNANIGNLIVGSCTGCGSSSGGNSKFGTTTSSFLSITPNGGLSTGLGIGTSSPAWALQVASSTRPQLALSDGSLTSDHWTFRNTGGNLFLATSSPDTFATSTIPALTINTSGNVGIGTSSPYARLSVNGNINTEGNYKKFGTTILDGNRTTGSTFVGLFAGTSTTANNNTFVGHWAGQGIISGEENTAVGTNALSETASNVGYNTAIGYNTLTSLKSSNYFNTAIGAEALRDSTTGDENTAVGYSSFVLNTTGSENVALGYSTGLRNTTGSWNTALGYQAIRGNATGNANVAVGHNTGSQGVSISHSSTTLLGYKAGTALTTGSRNILLGYQAGDAITSGQGNIILGYDIDAPSATGNNQLSIGNLIYGTNLDGSGSTVSSGNIGIGTSSPFAKFSIWGGSTGNIFEAITNASTSALTVSAEGFGTTTVTGLNINGSATTTSNVGINLLGGCFAISGTCLTSGGSSASSTLLADNNNFTGTNTFGNLTFGNATGTTIFNTTASSTNLFSSLLRVGGTGLVVDSNRRVGIGTSTPQTLLDIEGSTASGSYLATIRNNTLSGEYINFLNSNGNPVIQLNQGGSGEGFFYVGNNSDSQSVRISGISTVTSYINAGNFGIGDIAAGTKLSVVGNSQIGYASGQTGPVNGLIVNGSVGIGTTSPYAKLSVVGEVVAANFTATTTANNTFPNLIFTSATGTNATTTNLFSTTASSTNLFSTNANFGLVTYGNATGTAVFNTTASSTNLFATNSNFGLLTLGNGTSTNFFAGTASSTNLFATNANFGNLTLGSTTVTNLLVTGSSTLQNFTFVNATGTRATTTNFFSTTASSTNLFSTNANFGLSLLGNATSSNIFSSTASSTNLFSSLATIGGNVLVVTSNRNVGIGTTTPYGKLSITGNGVSSGVSFQIADQGNNPRFTVQDNGVTSISINSEEAEAFKIYNFPGGENMFVANTESANLQLGPGPSTKVAIGSTSPWGKLSVELDTTNPGFVVANQGSSTPSLFVGGVNQNGFVGFGTTTNPSLARIVIDQSMSDTGSQKAVAGIHQIHTFNPTANNTTQVGNRLVIQNTPGSTATNTAVAQLIRAVDNTSRSNLVRGLEVVASGGTNTYGVNTGIRGTGHTFGVQGITTGLAGGTSTPAAIYGENTGTTQGDILRLYTSTMTTATSVAQFYQETSTFTGTGLLMNFAKNAGSFMGNYIDFQKNDNTQFRVASTGDTFLGQIGQTSTKAGLSIGYGGICVDNDGTCTASTTGRITAREFNTAGADLAEAYYSDEQLQPGDIVYTKGSYSIGKAATGSDPIIGVVSTRPGLTLGTGEVKFSILPEYPVGLTGRVPVKLSTENGEIKVGDKIVLSSVPGVGMKGDSNTKRTVIGIALEEFDGSDALSEGTIEVNTQKKVTGTSCTTKTVTGDTKLFGGSGVEDSAAKSPTTGIEKECENIETIFVPDAGKGESVTAGNGQRVKIGAALVFLGIERTKLTAVNGEVEFAEMFTGDISLENHSIQNVKAIASVLGKWSISEDGDLVVESIKAKRGTFEENIEVGTDERPSGITIFDSVTGNPYCLGIRNGEMKSTPGKCVAGEVAGASAPAPQNNLDSTSSPQAEPEPTPTPESAQEPEPEPTLTETTAAPTPEPEQLPNNNEPESSPTPDPEPTPSTSSGQAEPEQSPEPDSTSSPQAEPTPPPTETASSPSDESGGSDGAPAV